jgi:hypothetical protein
VFVGDVPEREAGDLAFVFPEDRKDFFVLIGLLLL